MVDGKTLNGAGGPPGPGLQITDDQFDIGLPDYSDKIHLGDAEDSPTMTQFIQPTMNENQGITRGENFDFNQSLCFLFFSQRETNLVKHT